MALAAVAVLLVGCAYRERAAVRGDRAESIVEQHVPRHHENEAMAEKAQRRLRDASRKDVYAMRRSTSMIVAGGAVLLALATACGGEEAGSPSAGERPTTPTSSESVPATATTPAPPPATTTPVSTPTVQPPLVSPKVCTVRDLGVSLGASEGTAGTMYRALVFMNTGGRTCTIQGSVVTLKPGGTATSPVGFVNISAFDPATCQPPPVRGLRVYPPHERKSEFVPFETTGCAGEVPGSQLTVRTVHEGSGLE